MASRWRITVLDDDDDDDDEFRQQEKGGPVWTRFWVSFFLQIENLEFVF
jgi:hypothetical protein